MESSSVANSVFGYIQGNVLCLYGLSSSELFLASRYGVVYDGNGPALSRDALAYPLGVLAAAGINPTTLVWANPDNLAKGDVIPDWSDYTKY